VERIVRASHEDFKRSNQTVGAVRDVFMKLTSSVCISVEGAYGECRPGSVGHNLKYQMKIIINLTWDRVRAIAAQAEREKEVA